MIKAIQNFIFWQKHNLAFKIHSVKRKIGGIIFAVRYIRNSIFRARCYYERKPHFYQYFNALAEREEVGGRFLGYSWTIPKDKK